MKAPSSHIRRTGPSGNFEPERLRAAYLSTFDERRKELLRALEALSFDEPGAARTLDRLLGNLAGSGGSHGVPDVSTWAREVRAAALRDSAPREVVDLVLSSLPSLDSVVARSAEMPITFMPFEIPPAERATVLLVDDDRDMRVLVAALLAAAGYETVAVKTSQGARAAIDDFKPALILLDVVLSDGDGRELFRRLRDDGRLAFVPILFFTARERGPEVAEGFRLGADDYITKPIDPEPFLARVASRLSRARMLAETAVRDPLTGLYNRRHTDDLMVREIANARRRREPLAVAICDLDDFKRWNDTHGHSAGDEVLKRFAAALNGGVRLVDTTSRWGGEEFLVVLPSCDAAGAMKVMARVQRLFATAQARGERITFSAGLAVLRPDDDVAQMMARADAALYRAKSEGKDRVAADE